MNLYKEIREIYYWRKPNYLVSHLVTFTEENLNGKLHFCAVFNKITYITIQQFYLSETANYICPSQKFREFSVKKCDY